MDSTDRPAFGQPGDWFNTPIEADRRGQMRWDYRVAQALAPYPDGDSSPNGLVFYPVECYDLSPGGFSFGWPEEPGFPRAVVALGRPPDVTYITAEIAHLAPHPEIPDAFLVGCRFLQRVALTVRSMSPLSGSGKADAPDGQPRGGM